MDRRKFLGTVGLGSVAFVAAACGSSSHSSTSATTGAAGSTNSTSAADANSGAATKTGTIKVGGVFSQSGTYAVLDVPASLGLKMAVDDLNQAGGVVVGDTKYTFDLKTTDIASNAANSAAATETLLSSYGSHIIFGPCYSVEAEPTVEAVLRAGDAVLLSLATKMDSYVGMGTPLFRLSSPDSILANTMVKVIAEKYPKLKNLAAVFIDDAITQQLLKVWVPVFKQYGITISQTELFPSDDTNLVPVLQRVSKNVDGLFIGYTDPAATEIIDAVNELGLPPYFIARGSSGVPGRQAGSKAALYAYGILLDDPQHPSTPETAAFYSRYSHTFNRPLDANSSIALNYYPYLGLVAQAMKAAGTTTNAQAIAAQIRGRSFTDVMTVGFDAKGINNSPVSVGILDHGNFSVVK